MSASPVIQADASNIPKESLDCGIKSLGWCNGPSCQKLATLRTFVIVLSVAGILQGATETYFRISAKQAAVDHNYDPVIVDWLLAASSIFQALFALLIAYWSHRYHAISWLSGMIIFQSVACLAAIIPTLTHLDTNSAVASYDSDLCVTTTQLSDLQTDKPNRITTLVMLFVLQLGIAVGGIVFYVIGVSYMDDNGESIDSPAAIGTALAAKFWGSQFGSAVSLLVSATPLQWWLGWTIIGPLLFTSGVLLGLFPKKLVKTLVQQAAQKIIRTTSHANMEERIYSYIADFSFWPSLRRLLTNKILICNLLGIMFIQTAIINYTQQEQNYLQSRFYLPSSDENGLLDEWNSRFLSYILKPPIVAICVLAAGLTISKLKPSARKISGWNVAMGVIVVGIFVAFIFLSCKVGGIGGLSKGKIVQPYCSKQCICTNNRFSPVCPENGTVTFFSACHAGCTKESVINSVVIYEGCTCNKDTEQIQANWKATEGACNASKCNKMWVSHETLSVFIAAVLGSCVVGKVIITLRTTLPQDKALALALELTLIGFFAYIPGQLCYNFISNTTCINWSSDLSKCMLRETPNHGNILNILSASLILIGVLFDILVFIFSKNLNCYRSKFDDNDCSVPLQTFMFDQPQDTSSNNIELPIQTQPNLQMERTTVPRRIIERAPSSTGSSTLNDSTNQEIQPTLTYAQVLFPKRNGSNNLSSDDDSRKISDSDSQNRTTYAKMVFPKTKPKSNDDNELDFRMQSVREDSPIDSKDVRKRLDSMETFVPTSQLNAEKALKSSVNDIRPMSPETDF